VILAAVYLLWMVYRLFYGRLTDEGNRTMADMSLREIALMAPLAVLMFVLGFAPNPFLERTEPATQFLLDSIEQKRLTVLAQETPRNVASAASPAELQLDAEQLSPSTSSSDSQPAP